MNSSYHIRYIPRQEIDLLKWDACIDQAPNGLIYGRSFYLEYMTAGKWDALVLDDYKTVMPLTGRRKAGIDYLCQPAFTQQTGIFSHQDITPDLVAAFLQQIERQFYFAEIFLNYSNGHPSLKAHSNFILPLNNSYNELSALYKKDLVRNLKLAARHSLHYAADFDLRTAMESYRREYAARTPHVKKEDYSRFEQLCLFMQQQGQLLVRAAMDQQGQLLATAVLLRDRTRLYLLQSTTLPAGRETEANHFLLDQIIQEWAGTRMILDFEGSDLSGIAHFYRNFGSFDQPYFFYRHNRLPWPLRLLKN